MSPEEYDIPKESAKLLQEGILRNPLLQLNIPADSDILAAYVDFSGNSKPSLPINWRFAESISALKGLEALWLNALLRARFSCAPVHVNINTDHATLFIMSTLLLHEVDKDGKPSGMDLPPLQRLSKIFPSSRRDLAHGTFYRAAVTNIYRTKDDCFYHVHGSLNAEPSLTALNLPVDRDVLSMSEASRFIQDHVVQFGAQELDYIINEEYHQAGTVCLSKEEYKTSEHGKSNANSGLYEMNYIPNHNQRPVWWTESAATGISRPLAGLKVVDLTRIIAGPSITRGLAEFGASIMRVIGPDVPDMDPLLPDLNWGKWNCYIDIKTEEGKENLRNLIREADVVVDGYRPGVLERLGFGRDAVLDLVKDREYGLIYARENCYGWHGPWQYRSGWQQISDAVCGVSFEYGKATGHEEAITPIFPNSDYCTGVIGLCGIINCLIDRAKKGGSFSVDMALSYYNQWLVDSVGVYPPAVWEDLWQRHGHLSFRHYHNMATTIPLVMKSLYKNCNAQLFQEHFFEVRYSGALNRHFKTLRPILTFPGGEVNLRYNVGTRNNGRDAAEWPVDLQTEVIS